MTLIECPWVDARIAATQTGQILTSEVVPVEQSIDRVLAMELSAQCDLPNFDSSAMDGWAVCGPGPWIEIGDARAGVPYQGHVRSGEAIRIATGAVVPHGTTGILRWEHASVDGADIRGVVNPGADIRRAGEEVRAGDLIAQPGTVVTPAVAGFLAACGHDEISVVRRPRISVLVLGDELQHAGIPSDGRVRDSLGPQLPAWLTRLGATVTSMRHIPDDLSDVAGIFAEVADLSDVVVTTGGTASGPRDHVHAAIAANGGAIRVDRVKVRPGHPMLLATLGDVPLVGLPGNPHSAIVGLMTLAAPVIRAQLGMRDDELTQVRTASQLRSTPGHTRLIAGNIVDGKFKLSPYGGSAMLRGLAQSSGFAVVTHDVQAGETVPWLPLPT